MKILINATVSPVEKAGLGVYIRDLVDALTRDAGANEFMILAQDDDPDFDLSDRPNVSVVTVPGRFFRLLLLRTLLEQTYVPWLVWRHGVQVVHGTHYALPLVSMGARRVVTFHDMTFFTMPEVHTRGKVVYFQWFMRASMKLADQLIFVSQSAMEDCVTRLGLPRGGMTVVPHGKNDVFAQNVPQDRLQAVRGVYGIGEHFMLYLGTIEPRKNLSRLVNAFSLLAPKHPKIQLVLAGKRGWLTEEIYRTVEAAGLGDRLVLPGYVEEEDKPALLAACTLFVYPSLYEGFGLPVLEALACGAAVITRNTSSLPEVAGDAAVLIDPLNLEALVAAIDELLCSPERRAELAERGPKQASQFTWERSATLTLDAYGASMSGDVERGKAGRLSENA